MNYIAIRVLWGNVPVLTVLLSFWAFISGGHELTVSVAFTSIALFDMLQGPLNFVAPNVIRLFETGTSVTEWWFGQVLTRTSCFFHSHRLIPQ